MGESATIIRCTRCEKFYCKTTGHEFSGLDYAAAIQKKEEMKEVGIRVRFIADFSITQTRECPPCKIELAAIKEGRVETHLPSNRPSEEGDASWDNAVKRYEE